MKKLDELRQVVAQEKEAHAAKYAAEQARKAEVLEVAVQEDLPKWVAILEAAVKRKVDASRMELRYIPKHGLFGHKPEQYFVKVPVGSPIDVLRVDRAMLDQYARRITELLGPPFELSYHENSDGPDYLRLTRG